MDGCCVYCVEAIDDTDAIFIQTGPLQRGEDGFMQVWSTLVEKVSICSLVADMFWVAGVVPGSSIAIGVVSQHQHMSSMLGFWDSRDCDGTSVVTGRFPQSTVVVGWYLHPIRGVKTCKYQNLLINHWY